jgi:ribosomal protein L32
MANQKLMELIKSYTPMHDDLILVIDRNSNKRKITVGDLLDNTESKSRCPNCGATKARNQECEYCGT